MSTDGEWMVNVLKFADSTLKTGLGREGRKILLLAHSPKSGLDSEKWVIFRKVTQSQSFGNHQKVTHS